MSKKRSFRVSVGSVKTRAMWADSELRVEEYKNGELIRTAVIAINHPYKLLEIRRACDKIEAQWAEYLRQAKP